nr:SRPBCC family protein [Saccharopolyspora gloriosae]
MVQHFAAPIDDVWDACTNRERIARWFLPITGDLQAGGTYQLEGNAGGTVEHCDPPRSFGATWEFGGDVSRIEVRLREAGGGTRFELEHVAHVPDEAWAEYGPGAVGLGWDMGLLGLAAHLGEQESGVGPDESAWAASPEGVLFMTLGSEAWFEANVAAGTPEPEARAAADRTLTAYTTPPPES